MSILLWGCERFSGKRGTLHVKAPGGGQYEIYRLSPGRDFQLVSEDIGHFNEDIKLKPGQYLILADCSSEMVIIHSQEKHELTAHRISFKSVQPPQPNDRFLIQCTRFDRMRARQKLVNQFELNVLSGKRDLLVGMVTLAVDLTQSEPQQFKFDLAALAVNDVAVGGFEHRFFVSPISEIVSFTESQNLGRWLYLLPGQYDVELNGTKLRVDLKAGEQESIRPGFLRVTTGENVDLNAASEIQGDPLFVEVNGGHHLSLNVTYPVLPGKSALLLIGSEREHAVDIVSDQLVEKKVKSVKINLDCPPWDWNCLGSRKIYLFEKNQHYPFAQGITDVPLLYFEEQAFVSIEGSLSIQYELSTAVDHHVLRSGRLQIIPTPEYKQGVATDLMRLEATGAPFSGFTYDLPLEQNANIALIEGSYNLVHYTSGVSAGEGDHHKSTRQVTVRPHALQSLEVAVYVSEKRMKALHRARLAQSEGVSKRASSSRSPSYFSQSLRFQ